MTSIAPQTTTHGLGRIAEAEVDPQFVVRWSRRALSAQPISQAELDALFEAARWAPSANNLQPWLFVFAREQDALSRARALLKDVNQAWAVRAPVLVFVFARRFHPETGAALRTAQFDTGAAWQSLALQAHRLGLSTRALGGIHHEQVYEALGVPAEEFESIAGVAIGYPDSREVLPEALREKETPTSRKSRKEFVFEGRYLPR
jgi:nitroreductase